MDKPILFNTEMVQGILDGCKTVTRRKVDIDISNNFDIEVDGSVIAYIDKSTGDFYNPTDICKYKVGDILWIRETWTLFKGVYKFKCGTGCIDGQELYALESCNYQKVKWKPSIHMPRSAARIFLKVTGVRVERLLDITNEDAIKEGCKYDVYGDDYHKFYFNDDNVAVNSSCGKFASVWNRTIKKQDLDKYGWKANPFVWVIEFERIENYENNI